MPRLDLFRLWSENFTNSHALEALKSHCTGLDKEEVYDEGSEFKSEFKRDLETKLAGIFEENILSLTETEVSSMRKSFLT